MQEWGLSSSRSLKEFPGQPCKVKIIVFVSRKAKAHEGGKLVKDRYLTPVCLSWKPLYLSMEHASCEAEHDLHQCHPHMWEHSLAVSPSYVSVSAFAHRTHPYYYIPTPSGNISPMTSRFPYHCLKKKKKKDPSWVGGKSFQTEASQCFWRQNDFVNLLNIFAQKATI